MEREGWQLVVGSALGRCRAKQGLCGEGAWHLACTGAGAGGGGAQGLP
jgi:hypothetical protein